MKLNNIELLIEEMLMECETVLQFLNKLKPLEVNVPILFRDKGKKWLSELFEFSKGSAREKYESAAGIVESVCA